MASKVPIEIFMIGRTEVDREEVRRWLDFVGVSEAYEIPDDGAVTNPALLIAIAAKRCYKSWEVNPGVNPNITRVRKDWGEYLDNVMKVGHGSVLEHSVYNMAFENVSRVVTAEMNRHRAGWAISEGSLRFVRFSEAVPYWEPDSIKGPDVIAMPVEPGYNPTVFDDASADVFVSNGVHAFTGGIAGEAFPSDLEDLLDPIYDAIRTDLKKAITRAVFRHSFDHQRTLYTILERVWKQELAPESKFKQKKELTSLFRRIIGMGCATGGVWSGNIRALRHVLTMRCAPEAEEEILHVFSRVAMKMKEREPMLFGDFHQDENGFWRPKYKKV